MFPYDKQGSKFKLIPKDNLIKEYPQIWEYLQENKTKLSNRERGKFKDKGWYQLYPKNLDTWENTKIMLPYMIRLLSAL